MQCNWHLCHNELTGRQTKFCSVNCKSKYHVTQFRHRTKARAVEYKGGKCELCGYDKCLRALGFHHPNDNKQFGIAASGHTRPWSEIQQEIDKCQLVCANCHAELESTAV